MKKEIRILPLEISNSVKSDEELGDLSIVDCIYEIRRLRVAIDVGQVEITKMNKYGQVYIDSHEIWIDDFMWEDF